MKKAFHALAAVIIALVIWKFTGKVTDLCIADTFLNSFIKEAVLAGLALASLSVLGKLSVLRFTCRGIKEGLAVDAAELVTGSVCLMLFALDHEPITASPVSMVLFVLQMVLTGFAEEVLFRGIIQNELQHCFRCDCVSSARKAIIVSGTIFGAVHLMNISAGIGILPVLIQAACVIPTGIILSAVYYRSGNNLWVCIFLHSFNDFAAFLNAGVLSGTTQTDAISSYSVTKLPAAAFYIGIAAFLIRKSKIREIADMPDRKKQDAGSNSEQM